MDQNPPAGSAAPSERIIAAAMVEFAREGRMGARVDRIAAAAQINKRLLYHYVGDKAALFDAALGSALKHLAGDSVGTGEQADALAWRMLAQAMASGIPLAPETLTAAFRVEAASRDRDTRLLRIVLEAFAALLPELADLLLINADGAAGRKRELSALLERIDGGRRDAVQAKPRVKLRPDLRLSGAAAQ